MAASSASPAGGPWSPTVTWTPDGPAVQALGPSGVQVTVGDEGPPAGDTELAAVGVPGQDQVRPVRVHGVQHATVGGVRDAEAQVGADLPGAGGPGEPVPVQVGVCLLYTSPSPRDGLLSRMPS